MNYDNDYSANMDWVRKKFNLAETTSLYECVGRLVIAYQQLLEEKDKKPEIPKKRKPGRPAKRNKIK